MLNDDITRYVDLHRELGFKFRVQEYILRHFARFGVSRGDDFVRNTTVLDWARQAPSTAQRQERLAIVRRFAQRMQAEDERHEVPAAHAFGRRTRQRRIPHIYSRDEIRQLLKAASRLGPKNAIRGETHVALFALIVSTGLRISEALNLQLDDITTDGLVIRNTKFRKSRLVPLHPTARAGMERYLLVRLRRCTTETAVFLSLREKALKYSRVNAVFLRLLRSIGLRGTPGTPGPCIHEYADLFVVPTSLGKAAHIGLIAAKRSA